MPSAALAAQVGGVPPTGDERNLTLWIAIIAIAAIAGIVLAVIKIKGKKKE